MLVKGVLLSKLLPAPMQKYDVNWGLLETYFSVFGIITYESHLVKSYLKMATAISWWRHWWNPVKSGGIQGLWEVGVWVGVRGWGWGTVILHSLLAWTHGWIQSSCGWFETSLLTCDIILVLIQGYGSNDRYLQALNLSDPTDQVRGIDIITHTAAAFKRSKNLFIHKHVIARGCDFI